MIAVKLTGIFLFLLVQRTTAQKVYYVKPSGSSLNSSCPGQPCLTLAQYTEQTSDYFITSSTFVFLAGNHTVLSVINLTNISNIVFQAEEGIYSRLVSQKGSFIVCEGVTNLKIERLELLLNYSENYITQPSHFQTVEIF